MPKSQHDFKQPIEIAKSIYWVGMYLENDPFQCHPYFIENGNESILIDPGSMLEFNETVRKVKSIADIKSIKYIILHHQDPDLAAAVPEIEKLIDRDDLLIVTHSRMSLLIKHYLVSSDYYEIDKNENQLVTSSGFKLEFLTTPYCHSPGAFVSYEPSSKTLFSGDIFGGIEESWEFYADETYFDKAKQFHQEYMPSKDIFNYALSKIEKLDIELIAPQHGSVIQKRYIKNLINDMKNLDCGLYIEEKYNRELLDTINELQEKEKTIQERDRQLFEQSKRAEMGEMIGNIAHQWRQPLAIVNTILAILKEKNSADMLDKDEISTKIDTMEKRVVYMSDTIEDFMNYYKPNKDKSLFSIYTALSKALEITNYTNESQKIDINISGDKEINIYGLLNEFVQVIVSILSNIYDIREIRAIPDIKIDISMQRDEDDSILSISDNAGGIDVDILPKIFNPYFTTKHQSIGTGLGLHIAKMIIEDNMGGLLSAYNNEYGATFTIRMKNEK
ncbi:two-component sensor histidine kinase [Sulfurimonas gotlandica GD1]|uniref:histidine kinase n=1 Tax=Sulfurimonas gotlandica (strain DSM 19862 / JCM 16533 / GD1) TaxID=929558 RepID=B6BHD7_SULGG|nr:ATP-binding protein [Sulfurimonas gotlandica]EDZ62936.1 histidine kinase [Sulfurimonas gotlandica GD1]EHP29931.1 two-component sensor histidine kinase [Sulfurimonas gotlandica GD1]